MSGVFSKSILKVGTYHSPQGVVVVTPERLKHWETVTKQLQAVGYAIPSHFDHADDDELLQPLKMDVLEEGVERSAKATVGKLVDYKLAPDGQSAEIKLQTLTKTAQEAVESNAIFVSPVIYPEWKDGAGNKYHDVITSWDLVDHPVDYSQSSFVPATRMGLETKKPFLLSVQMADENEQVDKGEETASENAQAQPDEGGSNAKLSGIISALAALKVILPEDTDGTNFIERLETGLLTAAAATAAEEETKDEEEKIDTTPITAADPQIATMSLRIKQLEDRAISQGRDQIKASLLSLLKSGRCTPVEHEQMSRKLTTVKMSLGADQTVSAGDVDVWLKSRVDVPEGTFWSDKQRTEAAAQKLSLVEAPESWEPHKSSLSPKSVEEGVKALTRHRAKA